MTGRYTDVRTISLVLSPAALGRADSYRPVRSCFPTVDSWTLSSRIVCRTEAGWLLGSKISLFTKLPVHLQ